MPKTWSNRPPVFVSAAERARRRPSSLNSFWILLTAAVLLFLGLTLFGFVQSVRHPVTEMPQPKLQQPRDE